jgi:hypothetical protein
VWRRSWILSGGAVDLDDRDRPVGIEILGASHGIRLLDLIDRFALESFRREFEAIEHYRFQAVEYA